MSNSDLQRRESTDYSIVAIGGGHGLASTLRALRLLECTITAVVSVADDGGSTGRLRSATPQPAPGDIRKCLSALADSSSLLGRSLEYRFEAGEVAGHALGNLLIGALAEVTGDLVEALAELGRLIGSDGQVLPATTVPVCLVGTVVNEEDPEVRGQVNVSKTAGIGCVRLDPADAPTPPEVQTAIAAADLILLGPGSLYTSVLAAMVAPGVMAAVQERTAPMVYLCNLQPEPGEAADYDLAKHMEALARHGVVPEIVVFDPRTMPEGKRLGDRFPGIEFVKCELAGPTGNAHDASLLAAAIESVRHVPTRGAS